MSRNAKTQSLLYNSTTFLDDYTIPVGSISPYLGTLDVPNGRWIICDGVIRTSSDNRYADLATLLNSVPGFSGNTANSITPPNLQNKFLYGASTNNSINTIGSNNTGNVTLSTDNLPSHTHTITVTDPGHTHTFTMPRGGGNSMNNGAVDAFGFRNGFWSNNSQSMTTTDNGATHISITAANTGNGASFSIMPPYTTINYIIKY